MLFYTQHNLNWPDLWMCVSRVAARYRLLRSWPRLARGIHRTLFSVSVGRPCDVTRLASWFWHFLIGQLKKIRTNSRPTWWSADLGLFNLTLCCSILSSNFESSAVFQSHPSAWTPAEPGHPLVSTGRNLQMRRDSPRRLQVVLLQRSWPFNQDEGKFKLHGDVRFLPQTIFHVSTGLVKSSPQPQRRPLFSGWATGMTSSDCVD